MTISGCLTKCLKPCRWAFRRIARIPIVQVLWRTAFDRRLLRRTAFIRRKPTRENAVAGVVLAYHVIEKGLTMPNRRLNFGHAAVFNLANACERFLRDFGEAPQVSHGIAVLRAYAAIHDHEARMADPDFWKTFEATLARLPDVPPAVEPQFTRETFYAANQAPFADFARSRHTVRHYAGPLSIERIRAAAHLAFETAPSACNRQHVRLRCICDATLREKILGIQGGSRGFGHLADKVLIVSADLDDTLDIKEHNDVYVEGGIFLMNLCYALHYHKIAHCVLVWFCNSANDAALRALIPAIKETEAVVALLACGEAAETFSVAASPRRPFDEVYAEI